MTDIKLLRNIKIRLIFFLKNLLYYFKYYQIKKDKEISDNTVYFIFDEKYNRPGLADRLKAMLSVYYVTKIEGFKFKIIFDYPFKLSDYFVENEVTWIASKKELSYSLKNTRILFFDGDRNIPKLSKKIKQYHIYNYLGDNILITNNIKNYKDLWSICFQELFRPSLKLSQGMQIQNYKSNSYIAIHLRFVNALENFEDWNSNTLNEEESENLINRCIQAIREIQEKHKPAPPLIFSDSKIFLDRIREEFNIIEGEIGHISKKDINEDMVMKTFLDFTMISNSKKVYRIIAPEMYDTTFSFYAALSKNKEIEAYKI